MLTLKSRKSLNFFTAPLFKALARGNPLEFGDEIWRQKTRILGLPASKEIMTLALFVLTTPARDGESDGRTDKRTDGAITITRASIASRARVKNY